MGMFGCILKYTVLIYVFVFVLCVAFPLKSLIQQVVSEIITTHINVIIIHYYYYNVCICFKVKSSMMLEIALTDKHSITYATANVTHKNTVASSAAAMLHTTVTVTNNIWRITADTPVYFCL